MTSTIPLHLVRHAARVATKLFPSHVRMAQRYGVAAVSGQARCHYFDRRHLSLAGLAH